MQVQLARALFAESHYEFIIGGGGGGGARIITVNILKIVKSNNAPGMKNEEPTEMHNGSANTLYTVPIRGAQVRHCPSPHPRTI